MRHFSFCVSINSTPFEKNPFISFNHKRKQKARKFYQNYRAFVADRVGFEPTVPLLVHLISSQGRYDRFDTCPYSLAVPLYPIAPEKSSRDAQFFLRNYF